MTYWIKYPTAFKSIYFFQESSFQYCMIFLKKFSWISLTAVAAVIERRMKYLKHFRHFSFRSPNSNSNIFFYQFLNSISLSFHCVVIISIQSILDNTHNIQSLIGNNSSHSISGISHMQQKERNWKKSLYVYRQCIVWAIKARNKAECVSEW
jgi:hypothetical protein